MRPAALKKCLPKLEQGKDDRAYQQSLFKAEKEMLAALKGVPGVVRILAPSSRMRNAVFLRCDVWLTLTLLSLKASNAGSRHQHEHCCCSWLKGFGKSFSPEGMH